MNNIDKKTVSLLSIKTSKGFSCKDHLMYRQCSQ